MLLVSLYARTTQGNTKCYRICDGMLFNSAHCACARSKVTLAAGSAAAYFKLRPRFKVRDTGPPPPHPWFPPLAVHQCTLARTSNPSSLSGNPVHRLKVRTVGSPVFVGDEVVIEAADTAAADDGVASAATSAGGGGGLDAGGCRLSASTAHAYAHVFRTGGAARAAAAAAAAAAGRERGRGLGTGLASGGSSAGAGWLAGVPRRLRGPRVLELNGSLQGDTGVPGPGLRGSGGGGGGSDSAGAQGGSTAGISGGEVGPPAAAAGGGSFDSAINASIGGMGLIGSLDRGGGDIFFPPEASGVAVSSFSVKLFGRPGRDLGAMTTLDYFRLWHPERNAYLQACLLVSS